MKTERENCLYLVLSLYLVALSPETEETAVLLVATVSKVDSKNSPVPHLESQSTFKMFSVFFFLCMALFSVRETAKPVRDGW